MHYKVGQELLAYCTRCKLDLRHLILALRSPSAIAKVQCLTCRTDHQYRAPKGVRHVVSEREALLKPQTQKSPKKEPGRSVQEAWLEWMQRTHTQTPVPYSARMHFLMHAKVLHPQFGAGIVLKHIFPNKMEVLFEMDTKILIHAPS
jgi:hypothetical protein